MKNNIVRSEAVGSGGAVLTYGFDALGRMRTQGSTLGTYSMDYDIAGRRTRLTHPGGMYFQYVYDVAGLLTSIHENGATSGVGVLATYAYDNAGKRISITRGNGAVTTYAYDPIDRLTSLAHDFAGTTSDVTTTLGYTPSSQISTYSRNNDSYRWNGHYNVDRAYGTNGLNQLTTAGATALSYDARGNLYVSGSTSFLVILVRTG